MTNMMLSRPSSDNKNLLFVPAFSEARRARNFVSSALIFSSVMWDEDDDEEEESLEEEDDDDEEDDDEDDSPTECLASPKITS